MNVTCTTEAADGVWHVNAWFAIALVSLAVNAITMVLKMRDHIPGGAWPLQASGAARYGQAASAHIERHGDVAPLPEPHVVNWAGPGAHD